MPASPASLVQRIYQRLRVAAGPRQWWPCDRSAPDGGRDEIIIGAVLTQNTAWKNVEKAIARLREAGLLRLATLARLEPDAIAPHIRSSGYFNLKARRLLSVARFFAARGRERFDELARLDDETLRAALLNVHGVGPETADSILLYALERAVFVIDAYTLRIGRRHGLFGERTDYAEAQRWFTDRSPRDRADYNEYHALLVWAGHHYCRATPRCGQCPLSRRTCFAGEASWQALAPRRRSDASPDRKTGAGNLLRSDG